MTIAWTNDISNMLWHVVTPLRAFISNNNGIYTLVGYNNILATCYSLLDAQNAYISAIETIFSKPLLVTAKLMGVTDPPDGSQVAIITVEGGYAWGTWSESNQNLTVPSQTIPSSDIIAWATIAPPAL